MVKNAQQNRSRRNIFITTLMLALSVVVYFGVGALSTFIGNNVINSTSKATKSLSLTIKNSILKIDEDNDRLNLDIDLNVDKNFKDFDIEKVVLDVTFPEYVAISNLNLITYAQGVKFDQPKETKVKDGQKITIPFYDLNLQDDMRILSLLVDTKVDKDFVLKTQGTMKARNGRIYILKPFTYKVSSAKAF